MKKYLITSFLVVLVVAAAILWRFSDRGPASDIVLTEGVALRTTASSAQTRVIRRLVAESATDQAAGLKIDYPLPGSTIPPEIVPVTFLWHDTAEQVDRWLVDISLQDGAGHIYALVTGEAPEPGPIDPDCIGPNNEVYRPTPYQASARSWTPSEDVWQAVKELSTGRATTITIVGYSSTSPDQAVSRGQMTLTTSPDPVGAPIFYRDVPLMPAELEKGVIKPLAQDALPLIKWRLRDLGRHQARVVLEDMPTCANCHSFSADGKTLGMDLDGPSGDKGAYAVTPISRNIVLQEKDIITWNDFKEKPRGHKTIGFLSRVSPDGRYVVSTVNESLYVANFKRHDFIQTFYPTRGILGFYSTQDDRMQPLPGADDPEYVHCAAAWGPDGTWLVFARARAREPYQQGVQAEYANDPNETPIQYDLYRMPFNEGKGGKPEPLVGASANGMSNSFPKVSPDGKWVVFVKCRNGQLMRPDGRLWIVPASGGEAREMHCNTSLMNSWHSFSPNGRWMVFSSKVNTPYTQIFLTHIDEDGNDSPPILIPNSTAANRAANIPEFVNIAYDDLISITAPMTEYYRYYNRGVELALEGLHAEAVPQFRKALEFEPTSTRINFALGNCLVKVGKLSQALTYYNTVVREDPSHVTTRVNRGNLFIRMGHSAKALADYDVAIREVPVIAGYWINRGLAHEKRREWQRALADFDQAIRLNPELPGPHAYRGNVLRAQGNVKGAIAAYTQALQLEPGLWTVWQNRAIAKHQSGDVAGAVEDLRKYLEVAPADARERRQIEEMLAKAEKSLKR